LGKGVILVKRKSGRTRYIHEPKEVSRQQLINQLNVQYSFDFSETDKTLASRKLNKKNVAWTGDTPEKITKSIFNMSAAHMSCFFFTSYICTHAVKAITRDDNLKEPYHAIYDIPVSKFCEIVGADSYEGKNILFTELRHINGQAKVINLGDRYGYLPPFEVHFFSKEKEEMSAQELQHMANTGSFPIATMNIKFLKVLYDRFLQHRNNYINYPVKWPKIVRDFCKKNELQTSPETIMKAFTYLSVFDNSPLPRKSINIYEMIYYSAPSVIQIKDGKWYLRMDTRGAGVLVDTFAALQMLTTEYKSILSFSLDGILIPEKIGGIDFESLPNPQKIDIILKTLEQTNGLLPVGITRNKKLIEN
jgi:hypothetical protein